MRKQRIGRISDDACGRDNHAVPADRSGDWAQNCTGSGTCETLCPSRALRSNFDDLELGGDLFNNDEFITHTVTLRVTST